MAPTQHHSSPRHRVKSDTVAVDRIPVIGRSIVSTILAGYVGDIAVRLWDGTLAYGASRASCIIVLREPGALRELILHRNLSRLADSYLSNAIDVEGPLEPLFDLKTHLANLDLSLGARLRILHQALRLPRRSPSAITRTQLTGARPHTNSHRSIAHHYDVSNDFYRLWLDPEMVYSCAYFQSADQSLADAQRDKLDYLCRKLRLQPGQTLLDIGCGWGALALWAARHYGVRVHGITISQEQSRLASERVKQAGMEHQVTIEMRDYRDLDAKARYDRIVSVGMFEHIGVKNFPAYFGIVRQALRPGGLFLNHGITSENGWQRTPATCFMNRYVFPDGELARIGDVITAMERAGFEILDVEGLRRHYALTLRRWVRALEHKRDQAIGYTSQATYRLWRLYMSGCAASFEEGVIGVYQLLVAHAHQPQPVPLRRDDLYIRKDLEQRTAPWHRNTSIRRGRSRPLATFFAGEEVSGNGQDGQAQSAQVSATDDRVRAPSLAFICPAPHFPSAAFPFCASPIPSSPLARPLSASYPCSRGPHPFLAYWVALSSIAASIQRNSALRSEASMGLALQRSRACSMAASTHWSSARFSRVTESLWCSLSCIQIPLSLPSSSARSISWMSLRVYPISWASLMKRRRRTSPLSN